MKKNKFATIVNKIWLWVVLFVVIVGVLMGVTYYISSVRNALVKDAKRSASELTDRSADYLATFIAGDRDALAGTADKLHAVNFSGGGATCEILGGSERDGVTLEVIVTGGADAGKRVAKGDADGFEVSATSAEDVEALLTSLTEREVGVLSPADGKLQCFNKFTYADGTTAVIKSSRNTDEIIDKFCLSPYGEESYSLLMAQDGATLICGEYLATKEVDNLLSVLEEQNPYDKPAINYFKAVLAEGNKGVTVLMYEEQNYVFAYSPVEGTEGWYLVTAAPREQILSGTENILKISLIFGIVVGVLLVLIIVIIMIVRHNKSLMSKKDEETVRREQLFTMLASKTDVVFLLMSEEYKVEYVSPNAEHVLGIHCKDILHNVKVLSNARYSKHQSVSYAMLERMRVGTSLEFETERVHRVTKERHFYTEKVFCTEIEQQRKYVATISDRTKDLLAKQTLEESLNIAKVSNQSKSTFLANMSHDIRTPMNAIVGLGTLLSNDAYNPEKVLEHTEHLVMSSKHLMDIINNILDMSMLESSSTTLNIGEVNLSEFINEIDETVRPQAKAKNQNLNIVVAVKENNLMADRAILKRVLLNILTNAVRYTAEGGRIDFSVRQMARAVQGYVKLQFVIRDNGIGMSEKYIRRIFEPFSRELNDINKELQGTGLGLSIAKNLVELMGGSIAVDSRQGSGTTFTVNLKLQLKADNDSEDFFIAHGIGKMLVVGCNDVESKNIINAIHKEDVSVSFAPNLPAALGMLDKANRDGSVFNAVLLDWQAIEIMERVTTVTEIRDRLPALTPVVALSNEVNSKDDVAVAGIQAFIGKPFELAAFKDSLNVRKSKKNKEDVGGKTILYGVNFLAAEDNELNSMILVELLKTVGATCKVVPNGKEALDEFLKSEKGEYGAILMDIQMPVMDGYTATREIRSSTHPDAGRIPIIAMTANAYSDDIQNSLNAGMNDHIIKPINMEKLEQILEEVKRNG